MKVVGGALREGWGGHEMVRGRVGTVSLTGVPGTSKGRLFQPPRAAQLVRASS